MIKIGVIGQPTKLARIVDPETLRRSHLNYLQQNDHVLLTFIQWVVVFFSSSDYLRNPSKNLLRVIVILLILECDSKPVFGSVIRE